MYTLHVPNRLHALGALGVAYDPARPAWSQWAPGQVIDPYDVPDEIIDKWKVTSPGQPGWQATSRSGQVGCYCWGYRPASRPLTLDGQRWSAQQTPWKICDFACPQATCPTCPPVVQAPPCPPQTVCPPVIESTTCVKDLDDVSRNKNWLWLAGAVFAVTAVYGVRRTMQLRK